MNNLNKIGLYGSIKKLDYKDLIIFLIPFIIFMYYLHTFNPGILSYDSYNQLHQIATSNFTNWHPFFHTFIEMICLKVYESTISIGILQIIIFSTMWMIICRYNRSNQKQFILQIIFTLFISLIPINAIYSITLWKDILFSYFLMFLCFLIKVVLDKKSHVSYPFIIILALTMAIMSQLRPNGIYIIVLMLFILSVYFFKNNEIDRFYAILPVITIIFILLIASLNVVYDVEDNQKDAVFAKAEHMLSYYELNNLLTQSDKEELHKVINETSIQNNFDITFSDPLLWYSNPVIFEIDKSPYTSMAITYSLENPQYFLEYMFQSAPIVWDIVRDDDWKGFTYSTDIEVAKESYYTGDKMPIATYESALAQNNGTKGYDMLNSIVNYVINNKFLDALFESPALYMYLSILSLILIQLITKSKNIYLVYLPNLLNIIIIFVSTPAQDTRYLYPNLLVFYLLIIILIGIIPMLKNEKSVYKNSNLNNDNNIINIKHNLEQRKRLNMKNRSIIIIIILLIISICFFMFSQGEDTNELNTIRIGDIDFKIPEGFSVGEMNRFNDSCITNGSTHIYLRAFENGMDLGYRVDELKTYYDDQGQSYTISNFTSNDLLVVKLTPSKDIHNSYYWFEHNNKVYFIYSFDKTNDIDITVSDLIDSINP